MRRFLLKSPTIFTVRIIEHQRPIKLCVPSIALPQDVIPSLRSRAVALITFFKDAIVPKPNGIGKYLQAIPVDGQSPVRFTDDNCGGVMCARPLNGLLSDATPGMDPAFIGIMPKGGGEDRGLNFHHAGRLLGHLYRPIVQSLIEKRPGLMQ